MQAVSSLQSSEVFQPALTEAPPPLSGLAQLAPSPSQGQPSYIIQLPVDAANPALPGASYFIVTDPGATQDPQTRPLLLPAGVSQGQPLPTNQYAVATPPRTQGYPSGECDCFSESWVLHCGFNWCGRHIGTIHHAYTVFSAL